MSGELIDDYLNNAAKIVSPSIAFVLWAKNGHSQATLPPAD